MHPALNGRREETDDVAEVVTDGVPEHRPALHFWVGGEVKRNVDCK